jgi:hypothetical protein
MVVFWAPAPMGLDWRSGFQKNRWLIKADRAVRQPEGEVIAISSHTFGNVSDDQLTSPIQYVPADQ